MKIVNLTPHHVCIYSADAVAENGGHVTGDVLPLCIYLSEGCARASMTTETVGTVDDIPVVKNTYGEPVDLPDYEPGVAYIVSALTAQAAVRSGRDTRDLYIPAQLVRNEAGAVVGCCALAIVD